LSTIGVVEAPRVFGIEVSFLGIGQGAAILTGVSIFTILTYLYLVFG
jgi:hypothetical protein